MGAGDLLRRLDRRLLPPLARGMARLGQGPGRLRVLTGVALVSSAAVVVTAVWAAERRPVGDQTVGDVRRVGVVEGQSIPGYVETARGELAALVASPPTGPERRTYALVTFSAYLAPDRLAPFLGDVAVSEVFARLPLPDRQTQIVRIPAFRIPGDVVAGMLQVAERKDREALEYERRSAEATGGGDRQRDLRGWYDSGAEVARAEATAYRARCSCVYAAVVRADPDTLNRIAARSGVRAVDPAPEVVRLDRAVFSPPLPDQQGVVRPPADSAPPVSPDSAPPVSPEATPPVTPEPGGEPSGPAPVAPSSPPSSPPSSAAGSNPSGGPAGSPGPTATGSTDPGPSPAGGTGDTRPGPAQGGTLMPVP